MAVLAIAFLALHLPYLPASLEDLDSINFALGVQQFDVAHHQPHPPGYPVFIALAKAAHVIVPSAVISLALVSVIAATLGVLAIGEWSRAAGALGGTDDRPTTTLAVALAIATPLYWFTANRPLSDMAGLTAAIAVQALILRAATEREAAVASLWAGAAIGLRSQVFWLTAPLLVWAAAHRGWRLRGLAVAYGAGIAAWAIPLVTIAGGPRTYWRAVSNQGSEDLSGIRMLWTTPTVREARDALYYAFVAPWAVWPLAVVVLLLATVGAIVLWRRRRRTAAVLAAGFGPYLLFDILFQETFTSRYALPLIVPMAYLAASGARAVPRYAGFIVAVGAAVVGAHIGGVSLAGYARRPAPAFRLLADMRSGSQRVAAAPVLAMDRREALDLRRPIQWVGPLMPPVAEQLPSPPQHEWLGPVQYWNAGGIGPMWFVADPQRTDIDLIGHDAPITYRWSLPYPVLLSGTRPNEMDWYRIDSPRWYVSEGWALTPEAAGVSAAERPVAGGARRRAWIAGRVAGQAIAIGGRNFSRSTATVDIDSTLGHVAAFAAEPGFFARIVPVPPRTTPADRRFERLDIDAGAGAPIALEQFDAADLGHPILAFSRGWHEQEYNPATGLRWRWMSNAGELLIAPAGRAVTLHIEGESPRKYFSRGSRFLVRAGSQVVADQTLSADFSLTIPIQRQQGTITIETDQTYTPAARSRRMNDRRPLGLRIFKCEIALLSAPAAGPGK